MTCTILPIGVPGSITATLDNSCLSVHRLSSYYAKYYTFEIPAHVADLPGGTVNVQMTHTAPTLDSYLYLLNGAATTSPVLAQDDDAGGNLDSYLNRNLPPGFYTLECTCYSANTGGTFTITTVGTIPDPPPPPPDPTLKADSDDMFQEERISNGRVTPAMVGRVQCNLATGEN